MRERDTQPVVDSFHPPVYEVEPQLAPGRSTSGAVAWLSDATTGESLGVNPTHVVTLRPGAN